MLESLCHNQWLWFHMIAGGIGFYLCFWLLDWLFNRKLKKLDILYDVRPLAILLVVALALLWEVFEYTQGLSAYGGDKKRFYLDAMGDIGGAAIIAILVALRGGK